jgi:hypothetical protein
MISKKQYLTALNVVKKYEDQLHKKNSVNNGNYKVVIIDDTWDGVTVEDEEVDVLHYHEFNDVLDILLTEKQHLDFTCDTTSREFKVSVKRINKMFEYIKSDSNKWRN